MVTISVYFLKITQNFVFTHESKNLVKYVICAQKQGASNFSSIFIFTQNLSNWLI